MFRGGVEITMIEFVHDLVDTEIRSISGSYSYYDEKILASKGRDILYLTGVGCIDNSCCGVCGLAFVRVVGYIESWKDGVSDTGAPTSRIEPIRNEAEQQDIKATLATLFPHAQVNFD